MDELPTSSDAGFLNHQQDVKNLWRFTTDFVLWRQKPFKNLATSGPPPWQEAAYTAVMTSIWFELPTPLAVPAWWKSLAVPFAVHVPEVNSIRFAPKHDPSCSNEMSISLWIGLVCSTLHLPLGPKITNLHSNKTTLTATMFKGQININFHTSLSMNQPQETSTQLSFTKHPGS